MQKASWEPRGLGSHQSPESFKLLSQLNRTGVAEWLLEDFPEVTLGSHLIQLPVSFNTVELFVLGGEQAKPDQSFCKEFYRQTRRRLQSPQ